MRTAFTSLFIVLFITAGALNAQDRVALGIKAGGLMGLAQTINHVQEGTGTGVSEWSNALGYTGGLVLIVPVQRVDYVKFGVQYDQLTQQSFSILDSNAGPDYVTDQSDYTAIRFPITYHKQFQPSGSSSKRRVSFFIGGDFKFLDIITLKKSTSTPTIDETLVRLVRGLDPGIIIGAGLINGFQKSGVLHFEFAFQYHPIKNLNVEVGIDGLQQAPEEFNANTISLTGTYFFTKNKDKRRMSDPSKCPKL